MFDLLNGLLGGLTSDQQAQQLEMKMREQRTERALSISIFSIGLAVFLVIFFYKILHK